MDIPKLIKEAYQNVIDKGFFDCPECKTMIGHTVIPVCKTCKGSSVDPNRNIGELLMLIVSELGEALEAHRNNRFANWKTFNKIKNECEFNLKSLPEVKLKLKKQSAFSLCIKDTFEDEIADVFIRMFSLFGYLKREPELSIFKTHTDNIGEMLFNGVGYLTMYQYDAFLCYMIAVCEKLNIPIEKHIIAKMAYNKTRPHKHGKEY